jgi:hypothetical protein
MQKGKQRFIEVFPKAFDQFFPCHVSFVTGHNAERNLIAGHSAISPASNVAVS